ncbi:hypothetical protein PIB30_022026 [Stylosanthes scabra]|uniref:Pentatricopeptide repeat-containing protein n=1 Tax=Stylosanthes scabra TaxID=79078 RepID=A0ABU6Y795_9FABA|nr:hypothetical protein [Stylosanthes scabra]
MKENKILPDNFSYRICITSYGGRSNVAEMDRILKEMERCVGKAVDALRKLEERLDNKDGTGYNHLISLYAQLGNKNEVLRIWELEKTSCKRCLNRNFTTVLESLVKLSEMGEAEKILKEWESSGNYYDVSIPNSIIIGYAEKGLYEKAEAMLEDLQNTGKVTTLNSWTVVAGGYLHKGEMKKALRCLKTGLSLNVDNKGWEPNPKVISGVLRWIGDNGTVTNAENLVSTLRSVVPVNRQMYHALIKTYIREGKEVNELLELMKKDNIDENEETREIVQMRIP